MNALDPSEIIADLHKRADDCAKLADGYAPQSLDHARLAGKASAYAHAARLIADACERVDA